MSSNFRHHLLSLSLLVGIAAPWAAFAQAPISSVGSGSVEDRVTQLERISNAHSQLLTQLQQQLSDNQNDIDSLRGQIQESQYQLNQVVERQKQILLQMDSLSSGGAAAQAQPAAGDQTGAATSAPAADASASTGALYRAVTRIRTTTRPLPWCRINLVRMTRLLRFRTLLRNTLIPLISQMRITGSVS